MDTTRDLPAALNMYRAGAISFDHVIEIWHDVTRERDLARIAYDDVVKQLREANKTVVQYRTIIENVLTQYDHTNGRVSPPSISK